MNRNVYRRPDKPAIIPVTRRELVNETRPAIPEVIAMDKRTECHVTPPAIAERMAHYLNPIPPFNVLEPSAGTGSLIWPLLKAGHPYQNIHAVERAQILCERLRRQGIAVECADFLTWDPGREFEACIMNPPFSKTRQHIARALELCGKVVALVPVTFQHPDAIENETLPADTFPTARVKTKIITIYSTEG